MKVYTEWLTAYCDHGYDLAELSERLAFAGMNVEAVDELGPNHARLELEITSNRGDLLSHLGIARELSALSGRALTLPKLRYREQGASVQDTVRLEVAEPALCPRYTARVVRGVKVRPSPEWLRRRLEGVGLRSINNVVDVTNYVLYEWGQPLHAFDLDRLAGRKIVVRKAWEGERIATLDGRERLLAADMLVIADADRPVAVAGVMGGADTEVTERTVDLLLESACFDPVSVRRTARSLGLHTDSSHRFAHRVDPVAVDLASRRAVSLLEELAGGTAAPGVLDENACRHDEPEVTLRFARLDLLLGSPVDPEEAVGILSRLGFQATKRSSASVSVRVPSHRADVTREVDLVEEVARIRGYEQIPASATRPLAPVVTPPAARALALLRATLAAAGCRECVTLSFEQGAPAENPSPWTDRDPVGIANPVAADMPNLRRSLLPGLLRVRRLNADRGNHGLRLFETSTVYLPAGDGLPPEECGRLALLADEEFQALKGIVELALERLGVEGKVEFRAGDAYPLFARGAGAELYLNGVRLGVLGVVAPAQAKGLDPAPALAELDLDALLAAARLDRPFRPLPQFPPVVRDLAVVVDELVEWARVEALVHEVAGDRLAGLELFDLYRGDKLGPGRKSLAFSMTFRHPERTLTGDEVATWVQSVSAGIQDRLGGVVREA